MTPEQIEQHRKKFELLLSKKGTGHSFSLDGFGRYDSKFVWYMWQGYIMLVDNLEIDEPYISMSCCINSDYKKGFDHCAKEFADSLESQGIKVKSCK